MTTRFDRKVICANCGKERMKTFIGSTSSFGYCDLDTRPAPLARYVQKDLVDYCPECGYASYNIEKINEEEKKIVNTEDYIKFIRNLPSSPPLRGYMGVGYINFYLEKYEAAFFAFLQASWIEDDRNRGMDVKNTFLSDCIDFFNRQLRNSNNITIHLIVLDQLRRNKEFERAKVHASNILNTFSSTIKNNERKIVNYQLELIEKEDYKVHTIEKALNDK